MPREVPDFALNAAAVYWIEVGINGLKVEGITDKGQQDAIQEHEESLEMLWDAVATLDSD